jgi:hypothetical protein
MSWLWQGDNGSALCVSECKTYLRPKNRVMYPFTHASCGTVEYRCPLPRSTMACPNTTGKHSFVLVYNPYFYRLLNQYRFSGTNDEGIFVPDEIPGGVPPRYKCAPLRRGMGGICTMCCRHHSVQIFFCFLLCLFIF